VRSVVVSLSRCSVAAVAVAVAISPVIAPPLLGIDLPRCPGIAGRPASASASTSEGVPYQLSRDTR